MNFDFYKKESIFQLFRENNINFQKKFGQNFLIQEEIVEKIIRVIDNSYNFKIVEIGCGIGNITNKLIEKYTVLGFEIDRKYCSLLKKFFKDNKKFILIEGDFLKNFNKDTIKENEILTVFGAIPYYITTDIIEKILLSELNIKDAYLIIQKDLLYRIFAKPNSKEYGYLTILINNFSIPENLFTIKAKCFYPEPKVDSTFIRLTMKNSCHFDKIVYANALKNLFSHRRKKLKSNLQTIGINKDLIDEIFNKKGLDENIRIEQLSPQQIDEIIKLSFFKKID